MLRLLGPGVHKAESLDRREMLRIGALGMSGMTLPSLLSSPALASPSSTSKLPSFGQAKNCIVLFLSGGASQLDTFDPKPDAPDDIRGDFTTIETALPGVRFSEHLPLAAKLMDRAAVIRSMTHPSPGHASLKPERLPKPEPPRPRP